MALRITDAQLMMVKPTELTAAQALANRQGGVNVNMAREVDRAAEQEMRRTQATLPAEGSKINTDAEDGGGGGGAPAKQEGEPAESAESDDIRDKIARKMLSLPVSRGKFARGEEHKIDILV